MGNSSSYAEANVSPEEKEMRATILEKWDEVITKMGQSDHAQREQFEQPNCFWILVFWLQCIVCLAESPVRIVYHLVFWMILSILHAILLMCLLVLDIITISVGFVVDNVRRCLNACCTCCAGGRDAMGDKMVIDMGMEKGDVEEGSPDLERSPGPAETVEVAAALPGTSVFLQGLDPCLVCLGRSLSHHYFFLTRYLENMPYLLQVILLPCHVEAEMYLYSEEFIPLKRPPKPSWRSGGTGRSGVSPDCCSCTCDNCRCDMQFHCDNACDDACTQVCDRLFDSLIPVGSARRYPMRLTRSMYLGLSVWFLHPSLVCGPMCDCCRRCYDDYDARGRAWTQQRVEKQDEMTLAFFKLTYSVESFDALVSQIRRMAREEGESGKLAGAPPEEKMERGGVEEVKEGGGGGGGDNERENRGLITRAVVSTWSLTKGTIGLGVNIALAPARLAGRGVSFMLSASKEKQPESAELDDAGHEAEDNGATMSARGLKLVREASEGRRRELKSSTADGL
mmetsp:Transcript_11384/g.22682  ORF Transcript_11384/g.22682 Transcript_11384/m.22682 type:complete len:510 (-) Transcript_11384:39-1568(-)